MSLKSIWKQLSEKLSLQSEIMRFREVCASNNAKQCNSNENQSVYLNLKFEE